MHGRNPRKINLKIHQYQLKLYIKTSFTNKESFLHYKGNLYLFSLTKAVKLSCTQWGKWGESLNITHKNTLTNYVIIRYDTRYDDGSVISR